MTFKPNDLGAQIARRLTRDHGFRFVFAPEQHGVARLQDAINANVREGMDYPTWWLHDQFGHAHLTITAHDGSDLIVEAEITSAYPASRLVRLNPRWDVRPFGAWGFEILPGE